MSLLQQVMGMAESARREAVAGKQRGTPEKDPNQAVIKSIMDKALAEGNTERLEALAPQAKFAGYDPQIWLTAAGIQTPEQQTQQSFDKVLSNFTQGILSGKTTQVQPISPTEQSPDGTTQPSLPADPQTRELRQAIYDEDFLLRAALKKFSGIDIGRNYLHNESWFNDFGRLRDANVPVSTAINRLAAEYGFVPEGASNLKDLSVQERQVIFEKTFANYLEDKSLDDTISQTFPAAVDQKTGLADPKTKAGIILHSMSKQGYIIPERHQALLDRFRGLAEPEFIADDVATVIYSQTGKYPGDITPSDVQAARRFMQGKQVDAITQEVLARENAKFDATLDKPIPYNISESMGLPVGTTNQQLYGMNVIPLGKDSQESYVQSAINLLNVMEPISDRLFTSEGFNRFTKGGQLEYEKFEQSNPDLASWEAMKMSLAFALAKAAGERGVLSRQDVAPYLKAIPGTFHSKTFSQGFFKLQRKVLTGRMKQFKQKTAPAVEPVAPSTAPEFETGKEYTDAQGQKAKYLGEGKWQLQK